MSLRNVLKLHKHAQSAVLSRRELAGNFAQTIKGAVIAKLCSTLCLSGQPWSFIDLNAEPGFYDLTSESSRKLALHQLGINKVWSALRASNDMEGMEALVPFARVLDAMNRDPSMPHSQLCVRADEIRYFPTSASVARYYMGEFDHAVLLNSTGSTEDGEVLDMFTQNDRRFKTYSGMSQVEGAQAFLPPRTRQGMAVFEMPTGISQQETAMKELAETFLRWPNATIAVFYPMETTRRPIEMLREVYHLGFKHGFGLEFYYDYPGGKHQMRELLEGYGMFFLNPPWSFKNDVSSIVDVLYPLLSHCKIKPEGYHLAERHEGVGVHLPWDTNSPIQDQTSQQSSAYVTHQCDAQRRRLERGDIMRKMLIRASERGEPGMDKYFMDDDMLDADLASIASGRIEAWPEEMQDLIFDVWKAEKDAGRPDDSQFTTADARKIADKWSNTQGLPIFEFELRQKIERERNSKKQTSTAADSHDPQGTQAHAQSE